MNFPSLEFFVNEDDDDPYSSPGIDTRWEDYEDEQDWRRETYYVMTDGMDLDDDNDFGNSDDYMELMCY